MRLTIDALRGMANWLFARLVVGQKLDTRDRAVIDKGRDELVERLPAATAVVGKARARRVERRARRRKQRRRRR